MRTIIRIKVTARLYFENDSSLRREYHNRTKIFMVSDQVIHILASAATEASSMLLI